LKEADKRGAEFIATGHYARVVQNSATSSSSPRRELRVESPELLNSSLVTCHLSLLKGIDPKKDQSYFLYVLRREELKRILFPLGDYKKEDVRKIANNLGFPSARRPESQEICFIGDRNYFKFIDNISQFTCGPGPVMNMNGKILGEHKGIYHYTIGQRKGLGISSKEPLYVTKIDAEKNIVYVGSQEHAKTKEFEVRDLNWLIPVHSPRLSSASPDKSGRVACGDRFTVKIRSMMKPEPAVIHLSENADTVRVIFDEPQWATAPGQSAVFYDEDAVIGGGVIEKVELNETLSG
ncbi:MAG: hypothetical protein Q8K77_02730, partial [Thermodesulfovibrionales bacterium]|nr:hypothetical protein [Thermodesulfovibrionales bacterium]